MSVITWRALQPDLSGINFNSVSNTFNNATDSLNNLLNRGNELNTKNLNEGADMATEKMISMLRQNNTDLNTLNPQQAHYKDDAWIRQQVDPRYADRITPGKVTSAFGSLEGELNKKLYDQAAIQGKAEAERTGSIAQGAALTESLMRAGGMQEDRVSSNSTDLVNNQLGVMKAKLSEDTKNFTRDFISNTDFTGLKATDIPHILKSAEQQYGSRIDLDQVRSALVTQMGAVNADQSLELQRQSTRASLANSALALKANQLSYEQALKQSQIAPNPFNVTTANGITTFVDKQGVAQGKVYDEEAMRVLAEAQAVREDAVENQSGLKGYLKANDNAADKEERVQRIMKEMTIKQAATMERIGALGVDPARYTVINGEAPTETKDGKTDKDAVLDDNGLGKQPEQPKPVVPVKKEDNNRAKKQLQATAATQTAYDPDWQEKLDNSNGGDGVSSFFSDIAKRGEAMNADQKAQKVAERKARQMHSLGGTPTLNVPLFGNSMKNNAALTLLTQQLANHVITHEQYLKGVAKLKGGK